jgi:hypothetical protein
MFARSMLMPMSRVLWCSTSLSMVLSTESNARLSNFDLDFAVVTR